MSSQTLFYDDMVDAAVKGGYTETPQLTQLGGVFLLSLVAMSRQRHLWQDSIAPIDDTEYDDILDMIRDTEGELMTSFSIGSLITSFVDLDSNDNLLRMDGQVVAEADYPALADICPASWKAGGNITLPDMDDFSIHGGYAALGTAIGANTHQLTIAEMPTHTHTQNSHLHNYAGNVSIPALGGAIPATASLVTPTGLITSPTTAINQNTGGDGSHNNIPEALQVLYYIVAL